MLHRRRDKLRLVATFNRPPFVNTVGEYIKRRSDIVSNRYLSTDGNPSRHDPGFTPTSGSSVQPGNSSSTVFKVVS